MIATSSRPVPKRVDFRRPPPPPFYERGRCRLCGGPIPRGRFTWCGTTCTWAYNTASSPAARLRVILAGDLVAECWRCGSDEHVEVDHVRPLWSLTPVERGQLRWWLPSNLQLLCHACHAAKTAREATERARRRRIVRPEQELYVA